MALAIEEYTYKPLRLARWDFETPVAHEGITQYFPVRHFCKWLGVDSGTQVGIIKADSRYDGAHKEIPYKSGAGWRTSFWLRRDKLALWLLGIDPKRCAPLRSQEKLEAFQEDVIREAEALLFGAAPNAPANERGQASAAVRIEVHMTCADCGAPHYIVFENGQTTVVRVRGEE